jgi:hypothetical protein
MPRPGLERRTSRFEVQILGEELLSLLRRIHRQYVAFLFDFYLLLNMNREPQGKQYPAFLQCVYLVFVRYYDILDSIYPIILLIL